MPHQQEKRRRVITEIHGFEPLTGNYVYCPNQFFDICLSGCSRGAFRIIAHVIRQTLGFLDEQGNPRLTEVRVTYRDLIQKAGVSRGAIGEALAEAEAKGFLVRNECGRANSKGTPAKTATYSIRWSDGELYTRDLESFDGFFAGEGHRTPVPNQYFDYVVPQEKLSVSKVVGTVIRHTIGYQTQFGGRRSSHPLPYRQIQQYCGISDRSTLSASLRRAQNAGFIQCMDSGQFASDPRAQRSAVYAIHWQQKTKESPNGSKTRPAPHRFKNQTCDGSESRPAERFKNQTCIEKTESNNTLKQQDVVVRNLKKGIDALKSEGMDGKTATRLTNEFGAHHVLQQVQWLDDRKPTENRVGMLRKAIAENWSAPRNVQVRKKREKERHRFREKEIKQRQEDAASNRRKKERHERRERLLQEWGSASLQERARWIRTATKRETSATLARMLGRSDAQTNNPGTQILDEIARDRNLPPITIISEQTLQENIANSDAPLDVPKGVPITGQPAGHQTGRYNRTRSSLGQAEKSSSR